MVAGQERFTAATEALLQEPVLLLVSRWPFAVLLSVYSTKDNEIMSHS